MHWVRGLARVALLGSALALSACSVYNLPGAQPPPVETPPGEVVQPTPAPPEPAAPPPAPAEPGAVAAYAPLLDRARQATARGDYEQALALLERAQRIDPDSAEVYLAMAETHRARGDEVRARATAERGLLYCDDADACARLRGYVR
ncbi:MAG: hypothetical protein CME59_12915 [Halioglobus sp.]|nr:hypothetical protein [Halioglobus sp.]